MYRIMPNDVCLKHGARFTDEVCVCRRPHPIYSRQGAEASCHVVIPYRNAKRQLMSKCDFNAEIEEILTAFANFRVSSPLKEAHNEPWHLARP